MKGFVPVACPLARVLCSFLFSFTAAQGATINVPGDEATIQDAINAAVTGDEIVVAPGIYNECIDFSGNAITVRSSAGPEVTVIDGTGCNDSVVKCASGEGKDTVLVGFTITGGSGNRTLLPGSSIAIGGGMVNFRSSPTVRRCVFRQNGVATDPQAAGDTVGGGMFNLESNPSIVDCWFTQNQAATGGGIYNLRSTPCVVRCRFLANDAVSNDGGAVLNADGSHAHFASCWFEDNRARSDGGAMRNVEDRASRGGSNATLVNCVFSGNMAGRHGGALVNEESDPTITNCTFVRNSAGGNGGALELGFQSGGNVNVRNCILWGNVPSQIHVNGGTAVVECSIVEGGFTGQGNTAADPLLDANLCPQAGSPAIDAGCNNGVPADACDVDGDGNTTELVPLDVYGVPRFVDDPATADSGTGVPPIVDMGACEFLTNSPPDCSVASLSASGCWPPNHKFTLVHVIGVTDPDGDPLTITVTGITQDEPVKQKGTGSGMTCPDGVLVDTNGDGNAEAAGLRCERDGTGNGRVYSVHFTASDGKGGECTGLRTFCVVHDQRPGATCIDDGQVYNSTACPGSGGGAALDASGGVVSLDDFNSLTPDALFLRGDVDWNEYLDISDGIGILNRLFVLGSARYFDCSDAADTNDDGDLDISDAIGLFSYLYLGGTAPPAPITKVDSDPTLDDLGCQ